MSKLPPSRTYFDSANRVIRIEKTGFDDTLSIRVDTEYDRLGRVYRTSRPYYIGQAIKWTIYSYDSLGRVVDITAPDGSVTHTIYSGLTTTVVNSLNQKRITTVDSRGLTQQVTDDAGSVLKYSYDAAGRLVQTTDSKGNAVSMTYDLAGNKISTTDPDLGTIKYEYDALGQLKKQTDAKNQVVTFQYDLLGRTTKRIEPDLVSNWTYDNCYMGLGRLCSTSADNGYRVTLNYDGSGRVSQNYTTIDNGYATSFSYSDGRLKRLYYPSGLVIEYVYTKFGYLSEVRNATTDVLYWKANRMDAEGHFLEQTYGNGVVTQQEFDAATGRITAIRAGANSSVQNLAYTYDKNGNMLTRSDSNQSLWEGFLYDNLNRLTSNSINSPGAGVITQTYAYDSLGNITSRSDAGAYTYGAVNVRPHAVVQIARANGGNRQFTYDASGNLILEVERDAANNVIATKGRTETWTSFNMTLKLANANTSTQFVYGTDHQRIKEINPNSTTYFVHPDNSGGLLYEKEYKSATSIEHRHFITAGSAGVVAILRRPYSGADTLVYMHRDNLGSVTAVTDSAGNVIERMAYEPFGKRRTTVGSLDPNGVLAGTNTNRGYTNHEELDSLGFVHMNGRVYDPAISRFISADPTIPYMNDLQSHNHYAYTRNNPLVNIDPDGFYDRTPSAEDYWNHIYNMFEGKVSLPYINRVQLATEEGNATWTNSSGLSVQNSTVYREYGDNIAGTTVIRTVDYASPVFYSQVQIAANGIPFERPFIWGYRAVQVYRSTNAIKYFGKFNVAAANDIGQVYSPSVYMIGKNITFSDFAVGTARGFLGSGAKGAAELLGPMKELVAFSRTQGAETITLTGKYATEEGAALGGGKIGQEFSFTFDASLDGFKEFLKRLGKRNE